MIYYSTQSRQEPPAKAIWGRRAQTSLDRLGPAESAQVTNAVFAVTDQSGHGGSRQPDVQRVTGGRGLWTLRVSERLRVLFRRLENEQVEIVDVVVREGGRTFSELY